MFEVVEACVVNCFVFEVPLAYISGFVARLIEGVGDSWKIYADSISVDKGVVANAAAFVWPLSCQQHASIGGANGRGAAAVVESGALLGESGHVGRHDLRHFREG